MRDRVKRIGCVSLGLATISEGEYVKSLERYAANSE